MNDRYFECPAGADGLKRAAKRSARQCFFRFLLPLNPLLVLALCSLAPTASAQQPSGPAPSSERPGSAASDQPGEPLNEATAVALAVEHNPNLHVALLKEAQARYAVNAEDALYVPIFDASAGLTHARNPRAQANSTTISTSDTIDVGAGLSKTFPLGTVVALNVAGERAISRSTPTSVSTTEVTLGPNYSLSTQLSVVQPLMRGAGTDVGLATLRVARLNRTAAVLAAQQSASELLRDVLTGYWELWYAEQSVDINRASRDVAETQRKQAHDRVLSGDFAPADELTYSTQVAQLDEAVVSSIADRRQKSLALTLLLGGESSRLRAAEAPNEDVTPPPDTGTALDEAIKSSYQLKQLETEIAVARDQAKIAGDSLRPKLDLDGYVQAQGLGNREVPPALEMYGKMQAVSAHVGLTFETPVTDTRRQAQIQNALLAVHIAQKQLEAARQQLRSQVQTTLTQREAARRRLDLAKETSKIAQKQVEAEQGRFAAGTGLALAVMQAQDSYRQAQLRVQRARVDLTEAEIVLAHLRGRLLGRYSGALSSVRAEPNGPTIGSTWGPM
jgi:outer membrane protein